LQRDHQATGERGPAHAGIAPGREPQAPVEAPLRKFEPMNDRGAQLLRQNARAGNDEIAVFNDGLRIVRIDAGQSDQS